MNRSRTLLLVAVVILVAGWGAATMRNVNSVHHHVSSEIVAKDHGLPSVSSTLSDRSQRAAPASPLETNTTEINLWLKSRRAPERSSELLRSLEQWTASDLQPVHLKVFSEILEQGDYEECSYVISLLEQREEPASVGFLAKQLAHPKQDIRERALMACEAVAGTVFSSEEEAQQWAKHWQADPAVAELFRQNLRTDESSENQPTGPRRHASTNKE